MKLDRRYQIPSIGYMRLVVVLLLIVVALNAYSVGSTIPSGDYKVEMRVFFHIDKYDVDLSLGNNRLSLAKIDDFLCRVKNDSSITIDEVRISGSASPEGSRKWNESLAVSRMRVLKEYVVGHAGWLCDSDVTMCGGISDLTDLCREIESSDIKNRQVALDILADPVAPEIRMRRLRTVENGRLWNEIRPLLRNLRYATVVFRYSKTEISVDTCDVESDTVIAVDDGAPVQVEEIPGDTQTEYLIPATLDITEGKSRKPLYVSLKTNMLYDALLIPSVGAEVYLGKMMSINANWSYAWWRSDRRHNYWRYYGGDIALRRWFGEKAVGKPLTGHHLGLYAQILTYDFELGGKGQMGAKYNYGGGVEYGFSLPVARRVNIDFTIGLGYLGGRYHEYTPIDGHYVWQATRQRHWFGPTKAEISLVWLIGYGNFNNRKGDDR